MNAVIRHFIETILYTCIAYYINIYIFYLPYAMAAGSLLRLHQPSIVTAYKLVLSN